MMQVFNARIRLAGALETEVSKRGLTVPEIHILRRIHGPDAVVGLEHVGYAEIDPADERERLDYEYGAGLNNLHEDLKTSVEKLFGGDFAPLPEELRDFGGDLVDREDTLSKFQEALPFQSPNHEDRGSVIRKRAAEKKNAKTPAPKEVPPVKKGSGKAALETVL